MTSDINFNWTNITDPDGDNVSYILYVDNNNDFSSPEVNITVYNSPYTIGSQFIQNGENFWKVSSFDGYEYSDSLVRTFNMERPATFCGDDTCDADEGFGNCSADCGLCEINSDCDDSNPNTTDTCTNSRTASAVCVNTPIIVTCGDGTCGADEGFGNCSLDCGLCEINSDCDDSNPNTTDTCTNSRTASAVCVNTPISFCGDGDCNNDEGETCSTCSQDCGVCATGGGTGGGGGGGGGGFIPSPPEDDCGNGDCDSDESCAICPEDCGECPIINNTNNAGNDTLNLSASGDNQTGSINDSLTGNMILGIESIAVIIIVIIFASVGGLILLKRNQ